MSETKSDTLYDTLFKISQGNVELFKEETRDFLNVIGRYTGATVEAQNSIMTQEAANGSVDVAVSVK
jgi:hypothetical protein